MAKSEASRWGSQGDIRVGAKRFSWTHKQSILGGHYIASDGTRADNLRALRKALEKKHAAKPPSKAGSGKVVTTWDPLVALGFTKEASTKSPTKPWWSNL